MARDIDDIIEYVERHPRFSETLTEVIRARLESEPTRAELDAARAVVDKRHVPDTEELPGPDTIPVNREALRIVVEGGADDQEHLDRAIATLRADLSGTKEQQ